MKSKEPVSSDGNAFCAFLRGVNVKGTNMKMAEVCSVFKQAGANEVSSVLASGNILFTSDKKEDELKLLLEKAMSNHFSYDAFLFVIDIEGVEVIFNDNPFRADPHYHVYSFVGIEGIENLLMSEFDKAKKAAGEEAQIIGSNFYWKVPKGNTLEFEFGKKPGRRNLKNSFTSRNINTFEKVLKKMK